MNPILAPYKLELKDGSDGLSMERKIDIIYSSLFVSNLIFAKYLTIKDYTKLLVKFKILYILGKLFQNITINTSSLH